MQIALNLLLVAAVTVAILAFVVAINALPAIVGFAKVIALL